MAPSALTTGKPFCNKGKEEARLIKEVPVTVGVGGFGEGPHPPPSSGGAWSSLLVLSVPQAPTGLPSGLEGSACPLTREGGKAMGLPLLLPLLLLASLQAGEWLGVSCSARDPGEGLWLGVCRRVPWGSWPGLPPPTNRRGPTVRGLPTFHPPPCPKPGKRITQARGPVLPPVTHPPAGEGAQRPGVTFCVSPGGFRVSPSLL